MTTDITVLVNAGERADVPQDVVRQAVRRTTEACGAPSGEISVTFLGDEEIQSMNAEYLNRHRPTDVLSFSLGDEQRILGDVYVGYDQAVRQANEAGVPVMEELTRLSIHGVLHVLGHDHPEGPDRVESSMFALQERLVREVFPDPVT